MTALLSYYPLFYVINRLLELLLHAIHPHCVFHSTLLSGIHFIAQSFSEARFNNDFSLYFCSTQADTRERCLPVLVNLLDSNKHILHQTPVGHPIAYLVVSLYKPLFPLECLILKDPLWVVLMGRLVIMECKLPWQVALKFQAALPVLVSMAQVP